MRLPKFTSMLETVAPNLLNLLKGIYFSISREWVLKLSDTAPYRGSAEEIKDSWYVA